MSGALTSFKYYLWCKHRRGGASTNICFAVLARKSAPIKGPMFIILTTNAGGVVKITLLYNNNEFHLPTAKTFLYSKNEHLKLLNKY